MNERIGYQWSCEGISGWQWNLKPKGEHMEAGTKVKTQGGRTATVIGPSLKNLGHTVVEMDSPYIDLRSYPTSDLRKHQEPRRKYYVQDPTGELGCGYDYRSNARETVIDEIQATGDPRWQVVEFQEVIKP